VFKVVQDVLGFLPQAGPTTVPAIEHIGLRGK
jgi:hypothetical protein